MVLEIYNDLGFHKNEEYSKTPAKCCELSTEFRKVKGKLKRAI